MQPNEMIRKAIWYFPNEAASRSDALNLLLVNSGYTFWTNHGELTFYPIVLRHRPPFKDVQAYVDWHMQNRELGREAAEKSWMKVTAIRREIDDRVTLDRLETIQNFQPVDFYSRLLLVPNNVTREWWDVCVYTYQLLVDAYGETANGSRALRSAEINLNVVRKNRGFPHFSPLP